MGFEWLSQVSLTNDDTWQGCSFLTIDAEWVPDSVLSYVLDLIEESGVKVTVFMTHNTPLLKRMRDLPMVELGIHPNFNPLLDGTAQGSFTSVFDEMYSLVPEAKVLRSHCLSSGSILSDYFATQGIEIESNYFVHPSSGISKPWFTHPQILQVPVTWMDLVHVAHGSGFSVTDIVNPDGFSVYCFHPLPIYANITSTEDYARLKPLYHSEDALITVRSSGHGVGTLFQELLTLV